MTRTDRHQEMAQRALRAHQALTQAHVEGREPVVDEQPAGKPMVLYTPQLGERELDHAPLSGGEGSLRELRMYWKRIPDFGVQDFEIFPSETGWAQVLYWGGTGLDGKDYRAEEVDIVRTDDALDITRFEIYSDAKQWTKLVAYANDASPADLPGYDELLAGS
jgi:hypothetical protein